MYTLLDVTCSSHHLCKSWLYPFKLSTRGLHRSVFDRMLILSEDHRSMILIFDKCLFAMKLIYTIWPTFLVAPGPVEGSGDKVPVYGICALKVCKRVPHNMELHSTHINL